MGHLGINLSDTRNDTLSVPPPPIWYVIVGEGAAAMVNHTTLRQSKWGRERIGKLPVLHVGFGDPWLLYHDHGMGQPAFLMRMPGYHAPVPTTNSSIRNALSSAIFAASTRTETVLLSRFEPAFLEGWVAAIQKPSPNLSSTKWTSILDGLAGLGLDRGAIEEQLKTPFANKGAPYRLVVVKPDQSLELVYAALIDLCSGAGQMRTVLATGELADQSVLEPLQKTPPWVPIRLRKKEMLQRQVIHGIDGMVAATEWADKTRVCVYGGGGVGLNQIERAADEVQKGKSIQVDWYARNWLHNPTFVFRRNDPLCGKKTIGGKRVPMSVGDLDHVRKSPGVYDTGVSIFPASPHWRWCHNTIVRRLVRDDVGLLRIGVRVAENIGIIDHWENASALAGGKDYFLFSDDYRNAHPELCKARAEDQYDRLILCCGQQQNVPGEPSMLSDLIFTPIVADDGRMVALGADGGAVRVMGAAAAVFPGLAENEAFKKMMTYQAGLPVSAVQGGFILAGANVAYANGFFDASRPNLNWNTAPEHELARHLAKTWHPDIAADLARFLVAARSWPYNGIETADELPDALARGMTRLSVEFDEAKLPKLGEQIAGVLSWDYPAADTWS